MRKLSLFFCFGLIAALSGCGTGTTSISGKVTYQGKKVVYGTVVVVDSTGSSNAGTIKPDGSFTINNVKPGTVKVAVTSQAPPGAKVTKAARVGRDADDDRTPADANATVDPEVVKNWFPLPKEFGYPDESKISLTAKAGEPLIIDLK
jgi:uncharacterized protein YceK